MYLMKAKKAFDQQDIKELQGKREKYAERQQTRSSLPVTAAEPKIEKLAGKEGSVLNPEDLPDGACFRPKNLATDSGNNDNAARAAQYIGSFSVEGEDKESRARYVQSKLQEMRTIGKSNQVLLMISFTGLKVCSSEDKSVLMAHALKRISYATCDPENCQFSFLAREPKGPINIQFCHAFLTKTPEEAEELNAIVGNAFKMVYAQQREKQPTFHELIEQQITEQKAKYLEYQEQAQRALHERLTEIATPTPFSEKAQQRMELRRQSGEDQERESAGRSQPLDRDAAGKNRVWAKHMVETTRHRSPVIDECAPAALLRAENSRESIETKDSPRSRNVGNRHSTAMNNPSTSQSLSISSLRESFENHNNNCAKNKHKGSPVTALKEEIDRRYNGQVLTNLEPKTEEYLYPVCHRKTPCNSSTESHEPSKPSSNNSNGMLNRPLPAIPSNMNDLRSANCTQRVPVPMQNWNICDEDNIPPYSPPKPPAMHAGSKQFSNNNNRDMPKSRSVREMSFGKGVYDSRRASDGYGLRSNGQEMDLYKPKSETEGGNSTAYNRQNGRHSQGDQQQLNGLGAQLLANGKPGPVLRYQNDSPFQQGGVYECSGSTTDYGSSPQSRLDCLMGLDRSHIEDETLRHASWYQAGIPREIALEILQQEDVGSFIIRDSTTHPGCYALSVKVPKFDNPSGISHYLILKTHKGVKLKGLDKHWPNLTALVTHHTVMREMLPCTLHLPRNSNNPTFKDSDKDEKEEDPDYQRLADFSTMMASLKK